MSPIHVPLGKQTGALQNMERAAEHLRSRTLDAQNKKKKMWTTRVSQVLGARTDIRFFFGNGGGPRDLGILYQF